MPYSIVYYNQQFIFVRTNSQNKRARRDSNLHQQLRRLLPYPLGYGRKINFVMDSRVRGNDNFLYFVNDFTTADGVLDLAFEFAADER